MVSRLQSHPIHLQEKTNSPHALPEPALPECARLRRELLALAQTELSITAPSDPVTAFLHALPGADLHIHGGAMCPAGLALEIAWERSLCSDGRLLQLFGAKAALAERLIAPQPGSLKDYLFLYHCLRDYLFTTLDDIRTVARESALYAQSRGTSLLEIRTSIKSGVLGDPASRYVMEKVAFTPFEEFQAMIQGLEDAARLTQGHLKFHIILSFRRGDSMENSLLLFAQAIRLRSELAEHFGRVDLRGLDIAGTEFGKDNKGKRFRDIFRAAREQGFQLTAHAGEEDGVGEGAILHALNHLEVDRVGHGSSLYRPTPLMSPEHIHEKDGRIKNAFIRILQRAVPLEMCLSSNMIAGAQRTSGYAPVPNARPQPMLKTIRSPQDYPFDILVALGDLTSPNSRDLLPLPCTDGIFSLHTHLAREYAVAAHAFDLGIAEILALCHHAIRDSFAAEETKRELLENQWRPFASQYLNTPEPEALMQTRLKAWRQNARDRLGITAEDVTRIAEEVASPWRYA